MITPKVRLQKSSYKAIFFIYIIVRAFVCSLYTAFTLYFTFRKSASFSKLKCALLLFFPFM